MSGSATASLPDANDEVDALLAETESNNVYPLEKGSDSRANIEATLDSITNKEKSVRKIPPLVFVGIAVICAIAAVLLVPPFLSNTKNTPPAVDTGNTETELSKPKIAESAQNSVTVPGPAQVSEEKVVLSDPESIQFNIDESPQQPNKFEQALQELEKDGSPVEEMQPHADLREGTISSLDSNVMEQLSKRMDRLESNHGAYDERIEGTQKAITQVANLVAQMNSSVIVFKKDLTALRLMANNNAESIASIEKRAAVLESFMKGERANHAVEVPTVIHDRAVVNPAPNQSTSKAQDTSSTSKYATAYVVPKFKVTAILNARALVTDTSTGQYYPLEKGGRYQNIGLVEELDDVKMEVWGTSDEGRKWVIKN